MAFQSGTKAVHCFECKVEGKFFKMYQSFRPDHAWKDEEGRTMSVLYCVGCEVKIDKRNGNSGLKKKRKLQVKIIRQLRPFEKIKRHEHVKVGQHAASRLKEPRLRWLH